MITESNRRRFLQQSAGAGAVFAATNILGNVHTLAAEKHPVVRLGIIGCGGNVPQRKTGAYRGEITAWPTWLRRAYDRIFNRRARTYLGECAA